MHPPPLATVQNDLLTLEIFDGSIIASSKEL
jgi:hypothetical protein